MTERHQERNDALIERMERLVQSDQGLRHALPVSGMGRAELRGFLRSQGRADIWDSLEENTIGDRP